MKKIDSDFVRLRDILNAIDDIEDFYSTSGLSDRKTVMAIAYSIAIIGEAASKISEKIKTESPQIPWRNIVAMRHRIIHEYGSIDTENLKQAVEGDLLVLRKNIESILNKF